MQETWNVQGAVEVARRQIVSFIDPFRFTFSGGGARAAHRRPARGGGGAHYRGTSLGFRVYTLEILHVFPVDLANAPRQTCIYDDHCCLQDCLYLLYTNLADSLCRLRGDPELQDLLSSIQFRCAPLPGRDPEAAHPKRQSDLSAPNRQSWSP